MSPLKAGSEAAFQTQVVNLAELYGWRVYHTHDSRRSQAGFPDLVLVRGPDLIFAELKTDIGRVKPEQADWITALTLVSQGVKRATDDQAELERVQTGVASEPSSHVDVYIWRPADFDQLHLRLSRGRHMLQPLYRDAA